MIPRRLSKRQYQAVLGLAAADRPAPIAVKPLYLVTVDGLVHRVRAADEAEAFDAASRQLGYQDGLPVGANIRRAD